MGSVVLLVTFLLSGVAWVSEHFFWRSGCCVGRCCGTGSCDVRLVDRCLDRLFHRQFGVLGGPGKGGEVGVDVLVWEILWMWCLGL